MKQFKIAFYIRCSTEEQGLHANPEGTIKNQEQRLRYEVEGKNRGSTFGEVVGVFVEDGLSAKDTKRPALQRMLKAIELGEINLVMVTEYSRLSRSMRDFSAMWELFKSYKCSVISLRENFDTSTAAGEMMLYNMANLAQYERRMTSERVIASRIDRSRRGLFNGGIIPLGYKKADRAGYLEVDEHEVKIVQIAFSQFLKIGTLLRTAKWLNENKIHLPLEVKGSGKSRLGHFTVGNLRFILTNKAYIGITTFKKAGIEIESKAAWPGLVDKTDFYKIQETIKENFQKKKPHQKSRYPYTLSGLVFCKRCGEVMCEKSAHGRTKKVGYYEHSWSMRKDAALTQKSLDCGMHRRVPAKIIEALVHEKIEELLLREEVAIELIHDVQKMHKEANVHNDKEKKHKNDLASYSTQLETLAERLAKLPANVPADEIYKTMRLIGEKKEKVSRELDAFLSSDRLGQEVPVELKDYEQFVKAMKVMWFNPESNSDLKEKIVKKFIARIEIDVDSITVDFWMGKGFFQRESRSLDLPPVGQVLERAENLKILGSSTLQSGGGDGYLVELRGTNDRTSISMHYSIDWKSRRPVPYYFMSI
jgi:DNA invertase Pin-like site-specific DNA recombinase